MVAAKSPSSSSSARPCPVCAGQADRAAFQFPYCSEQCRRASRAGQNDAGEGRLYAPAQAGSQASPDWREFIAG